MAQYQTARAAAGVRTAEIDEGLRAHMNKVYGLMSVGLLLLLLLLLLRVVRIQFLMRSLRLRNLLGLLAPSLSSSSS